MKRLLHLAACGLLVSGLGAQGPSRDVLRRLALRGDTALTRLVLTSPDSARATFSWMIGRTAGATAAAEVNAELLGLRQLAAAYAGAWNDSLLVRVAGRFERWSPRERRMKAAVDSLRVAGGSALATAGATEALRAWRESLRLASSIGDSQGMAAAAGNIGVGFYREDRLDSARAYAARAQQVAERIGDTRTAANAIGLLASIAKDEGNLPGADILYARALSLRTRTGDDRGAASDENNLGLIAQERGDTAGAKRWYQAALRRNRAAGRMAVATTNLTNLANLATIAGQYGEARVQYNQAIAIQRAAGTDATLAPVLHNLGLLQLRQGDYVAARAALSEAADIFASTGPVSEAIATGLDLAATAGAMGDLEAALAALRRADSMGAMSKAPDLRARVALGRGDLAVTFNSLADAEREYAAAASAFGAAGDRKGEADAEEGLAMLRLRRDDPSGARTALEHVLQMRVALGDRRAVAETTLLLGHALAVQGDSGMAVRRLQDATSTFRSVGDPVGEAVSLGAAAELDLAAGRVKVAEAGYARALERLGTRLAPDVWLDLKTGHAMAQATRGALAPAAAELHLVIDSLEQLAGRIRPGDRRTGYRAERWDPFFQLALIEQRLGRAAAAFDVSERLRGRQMLDLMEAGRITPALKPGDALLGEEQDLRRRITLLERATADEEAGSRVRGLPVRVDVIGSARGALDAAQREYAAVLRRIGDEAPEYAELVHPTTAGVTAVQSRLTASQALVEYLVTDSTTLAFVVRRDGVSVVDLHIGRHALALAVDFTRETIAAPPQGLSAKPWTPPLRRLHDLLISPIEQRGLLSGVRELLIAPHAELHYLPFAALIARTPVDRFLVEQYDVMVIPSASIWLRLGDRAHLARGSGAVAFAPRPGALPASRGEVNALHDRFGRSATVLTGAAATKAAFRSLAPKADVIHFATYGVLNKHNPLFSFVELAGEGREDGHLAVHELFGMRLNASLVVLSACQTALGSGALADVPAGDDWVGLVRGFLFAGADNVMATLWPVMDESAAGLMEEFYRRLTPGTRYPLALAEAQRAAIRKTRTANPAHWAGFVVVGG